MGNTKRTAALGDLSGSEVIEPIVRLRAIGNLEN